MNRIGGLRILGLFYSVFLTVATPLLMHLFFTCNHKKNLQLVINRIFTLRKKTGKFVYAASGKTNATKPNYDTTLLLINLTWVVTFGFVLSLLQVKYSTFFLFPLGLFILNIAINVGNKKFWLETVLQKKMWTILLCSLFSYGPQLLNSFQKGQLLGMASQRNNDVVYYALTTKAFLDNGFINNYQLLNQDVNEAALKYQHQGATQIISFISESINLPPYQCMNIVAIFIILETILILTRTVKILCSQLKLRMATAIATGVTTTPILNYIYSNYFLGQMTGILITACLSLLLCRFAKNQIEQNELFLQVLTLTVLSIYFYPTALIIFLGFTLIFLQIPGFNITFIRKVDKQAQTLRRASIFGFLSGLVISAPYLVFAINFVMILSKGNYGWPIRPLDPLSIFVSTKYIDQLIPAVYLQVLSWLLLVALVLFVIKYAISIPKSIIISLIPIICFVVIYVYEIGGSDWGQYKNWKLISFFMPHFLVIFYCGLMSQKKLGQKILLFILLTSFTSPYIAWLPILQDKVPSNVLTSDQVNLGKDDNLFLKKYESISVSMPTWFETMAMANILNNKHIALISPSYLPVVPVDSRACILQPKAPLNSGAKDSSSKYQLKTIDGAIC